MPDDRLGIVLAAIAHVESADASIIDRACLAAVSLLSLTGAGISLMLDGQLRSSAGASDAVIAVVQRLQFELGEGPCIQAWNEDAPVLEPDLVTPRPPRWPFFGRAGVEAGVAAVFAYPLRLGAIRLGALVLYRDRAGPLSRDERATATVLAEVVSQIVLLVQAGAPPDRLHELLVDESVLRAEVHQATGVISAQLEISIDDAFARLRAHAFSTDRPLREISRAVLSHKLYLDPDR